MTNKQEHQAYNKELPDFPNLRQSGKDKMYGKNNSPPLEYLLFCNDFRNYPEIQVLFLKFFRCLQYIQQLHLIFHQDIFYKQEVSFYLQNNLFFQYHLLKLPETIYADLKNGLI